MMSEAITRRFVAPVGVPVKLRQLAGACVARSGAGQNDGLAALAGYLRVRYVFGAGSGRAALWAILRALHELRPERDVVAIPAYTCFSVPAAVVRAGFKLYPLELDPETLDFDYSAMERTPEKHLLCVVSANLFGYVNDLGRMRQIAAAKGAFLVDDAAQALGAERDGELAGTAADVGFYSLARGKPLAAGEGGVMVTNNPEIAEALVDTSRELRSSSSMRGAALFCKVVATSLLLSPTRYWIPNSLPFLKLGITEYKPGFPVTGLPRLSRVLLSQLLSSLNELNQGRRSKAGRIASALAHNSKVRIPRPALSCSPTFVRLPLLARDEATRDRAVRELVRAGIGASGFYPQAVCDIPGISAEMAGGDFHRPGAEDLARRLLTLPTHPLVNDSDLGRMGEVLENV